MTKPESRELTLTEAVGVFEAMPAEWHLASLHPAMVEVDAKRDLSLRPVHWCFRDGERCLLHSFHLGENRGFVMKDIQSAYGYGGPLSNTDDAPFLAAADLALKQWARDHAVVAEFLRFHPLVPHARWYAGDVAHNRDTVHIDLAGDLFERYPTRRRTDIRRFLEGGVRVEKVPPAVMQGSFPGLYRENMDRIGAASSYYFPEGYFDALFRFGGAENWLAYAGDRAIAGAVVLVSARARIAEYHLGAKTDGSDRQRATIGLLHVAASFYQSMQFRYFYLGGGRSVATDDSLLFFKKGFSPLTGRFQTGSRVYDAGRYAELKGMFPDKAATGRVLFYKT